MNQSRVNAGIPTGGQFAERQRSEASINLERQLSIASARIAEAEHSEQQLIRQLFAQNLLDAHPNAATAELSLNLDMKAFFLETLLDENGQGIEVAPDLQYVRFNGELPADSAAVTARFDGFNGNLIGAGLDLPSAAAGE